MKAILKSVVASILATGLASFFLLMITVGVLAGMARMAAPAQAYPLIDPSGVMRQVGLPLAGVMFVVFFLLALRRFSRPEEPRAQGS